MYTWNFLQGLEYILYALLHNRNFSGVLLAVRTKGRDKSISYHFLLLLSFLLSLIVDNGVTAFLAKYFKSVVVLDISQ